MNQGSVNFVDIGRKKNGNTLPRKYVRYKEGAVIYGMGITKFQEFAKEAKAVYKIDGVVLVNVEKMDQFIESFRL